MQVDSSGVLNRLKNNQILNELASVVGSNKICSPGVVEPMREKRVFRGQVKSQIAGMKLAKLFIAECADRDSQLIVTLSCVRGNDVIWLKVKLHN